MSVLGGVCTWAAVAFCTGCFITEADPDPIEVTNTGGADPAGGSGGGAPEAWCDEGVSFGRRPARGIDLTQIYAYQGVEIPLAISGSRVKTQNVDVVQGRDMLVRAFVQPTVGYAPKRLGARLSLVRADRTVEYEDVRTVTTASERSELGSTFDFYVPGSDVLREQGFSVEIFEEGTCNASGVVATPRFPSKGAAPLVARATGSVRVVLVPIRYERDGSGRMPDMSPEHRADLEGLLRAIFPVSGVEMRVRAPVATRETDLGDVLNQLLQLRELDDPPSDVTYFGLVNMADTMAQYCRTGCVAGVATFGTPAGSAAAGVGVGFRGPAQETFVHEMGHVHRLLHAPCGGASGADPTYPYADGLLGSWGFDARLGLLIDPGSERRDFMSYCDPSWISDYNYQALVERLAVVNGRRYSDVSSELADVVGVRTTALGGADTAAHAIFQTLRLRQGQPPRWGTPLATRGQLGEAENALVRDSGGELVATITVYRQALSDEQGALVFVPQPDPGWHSIEVRGEPPALFASPATVGAFEPVN